MHPILFRIGDFEIASYGLALLIAFSVGVFIARARAERAGLDGNRILDVSMIIIVTSMFGARLLYVVTHLERFRPPLGSWSEMFNPFQADGFGLVGLSMMGGVVLATVSSLAFFVWKRLPMLRYTDILMPSVALGEGITRIGCFLNGCCFGKFCSLPWGVTFPAFSGPVATFGDVPLHPTQLYASAWGFVLFGLLVWAARKPRAQGTIFCLGLIGIAGMRIVIDFFRYYEPSVIVGEIFGSTINANQVLSAGLVLAGALGLTMIRRRRVDPA